MLEKYINGTNKKFIATTLALTLTFSSCATLSSFKTNAEGEENEILAVSNDGNSNVIEAAETEYERVCENYEDSAISLSSSLRKYIDVLKNADGSKTESDVTAARETCLSDINNFETAAAKLIAISTEGSTATATSDDIEIESAKNKVKVCFDNFKNAWDSYFAAMQNYINVLINADGSTTSDTKSSAFSNVNIAEINFIKSEGSLLYAKSDLKSVKWKKAIEDNKILEDNKSSDYDKKIIEEETAAEKDDSLDKMVSEFEKKFERIKAKKKPAALRKKSTMRSKKSATQSEESTVRSQK